MTSLVLRIPYATPSLNEIANRRTRWAYRTAKTRWMRRLSDAYLAQRAALGRGRREIWCKPPRCRVRVTVERYGRSENALDRDNFVGGLKPVLDALRLLEFVDDDRDQAIELVATQPKNPHRTPLMWTEIRLERLDD